MPILEYAGIKTSVIKQCAHFLTTQLNYLNVRSVIFLSVQKLKLKDVNKAFVGLESCDNVQIERSIFEYANWKRLQV